MATRQPKYKFNNATTAFDTDMEDAIARVVLFGSGVQKAYKPTRKPWHGYPPETFDRWDYAKGNDDVHEAWDKPGFLSGGWV